MSGQENISHIMQVPLGDVHVLASQVGLLPHQMGSPMQHLPQMKQVDSQSERDDLEDDDDKKGKKRKKGTSKTPNSEASEARRESHKIIEQKRRQKINEKINELRDVLNYPDGSQNKAIVLQAAVDNIRNLKTVCGRLIMYHRQVTDDYSLICQENEKLKKYIMSLNPNANIGSIVGQQNMSHISERDSSSMPRDLTLLYAEELARLDPNVLHTQPLSASNPVFQQFNMFQNRMYPTTPGSVPVQLHSNFNLSTLGVPGLQGTVPVSFVNPYTPFSPPTDYPQSSSPYHLSLRQAAAQLQHQQLQQQQQQNNNNSAPISQPHTQSQPDNQT